MESLKEYTSPEGDGAYFECLDTETANTFSAYAYRAIWRCSFGNDKETLRVTIIVTDDHADDEAVAEIWRNGQWNEIATIMRQNMRTTVDAQGPNFDADVKRLLDMVETVLGS